MNYRNWCFTDHGSEDPKDIGFKYIVYQREVCPTTKKEHWQGYVEFENGRSLASLKKQWPSVHLEPRKGTQTQARKYCMKDESRAPGCIPVEKGEPGRQGSRTDLDSMVDAIEDGATSREIFTEFRGNAFRHLGMIERGIEVVHGWGRIGIYDRMILKKRSLTAKSKVDPEVKGNTILSLQSNFTVEDEVMLKFAKRNESEIRSVLQKFESDPDINDD